MKSIIEEFMLSELYHDMLKIDPKRIKEMGLKEIKFEKSLSKKEKKSYRIFSDEKFDFDAEREVECFKCGFKLGFNLFLEAIK
ncbi:MAG: hypothetical protein FWE74_06615 [Oscillospiraceae bacterium]|nr:hypothetical protein [Oscillospiraceae bacterium]